MYSFYSLNIFKLSYIILIIKLGSSAVPFSFERLDIRGRDISEIVKNNEGNLVLVGLKYPAKENYVYGLIRPLDSYDLILETIKGELKFSYKQVDELFIARH